MDMKCFTEAKNSVIGIDKKNQSKYNIVLLKLSRVAIGDNLWISQASFSFMENFKGKPHSFLRRFCFTNWNQNIASPLKKKNNKIVEYSF